MVYRDVFGRPDARVDISYFGGCMSDGYYASNSGIYDPDGTYASRGIISYPSRKWDGNTPIESIISEMENDGFVCEVKKNGYGKPIIKCIHKETQTIIDAKKQEQDQKFIEAVPGFVRFGELPEGGRSKNHRDDLFEAGVSCFHAEFAKDGSYRLLLNPILEVSYYSVSNRTPYRLYGDIVGTGADGEPLLHVTHYEEIGHL